MNDSRSAERQRRWGFDPRFDENEYFGSFTLAEAIQSLTETTRSKPVTVRLHNAYQDADPEYPVVIDLARPLWLREDIGDDGKPNWYFEGWILAYGTRDITRVRIHVSTCYEGDFREDDIFTWQKFVELDNRLPLDATLMRLGLRTRAIHLLGRKDVRTIGDLLEYALRHDWSEIPEFGPTLRADVKEKMAAAGYELQ